MTVKKRKWVITSAWPYVNAIPHLGNLIGSVLSGDVFARYVRAIGDEGIYVSGSDAHGTPVAVSAIKEETTPQALSEKNHKIIKTLFEKWNILYDNYTQTHNPTHIKFVQDFYEQVETNGFVSTKVENAFYCEKCELFLPDRFLVGTCPKCNSERARGDQCDSCGQLLEPEELINPKCKHCGSKPVLRETKHWYLDFGKTESGIRKFVENNDYLPPNARTASLNFLEEGLPSRAITRDLDWGIPAPFAGADDKTIYVWFEAVLGYISAVKEWAEKLKNDPDKFSYFWNDSDTRTVYFIGKDNIIFHLIIFPGLLVAYNKNLPKEQQFVMPYNVSSTEFLNYENDKFSKSRGVGIWIDDALELAPVEYWRYSLLRNRPEKQDTNFLWKQFEKDILELNDIIGNFIHRTLTFIWKKYDGKVPTAPPNDAWDEEDQKLVSAIQTAPAEIANLMEKFKIKAALNEIIKTARIGNVYINNKAPWKTIKNDKEKAGYTFYFAIQMVRSLGVLLSPFIPGVSKKIFKLIQENDHDLIDIWKSASEFNVEAGRNIKKPKPLFEKLDIDEMKAKLDKIHGKQQRSESKEKSQKVSKKKPVKPEIDYKTFANCDFRIGTVINAEPVTNADKLLKLLVEIGEDKPRPIVAGIAEEYTPDELVGNQVVILANLEPKVIRGVLSYGMLLAVDMKKKGAALIKPGKSVPNGSRVR